jgi:hypothetical protein
MMGFTWLQAKAIGQGVVSSVAYLFRIPVS